MDGDKINHHSGKGEANENPRKNIFHPIRAHFSVKRLRNACDGSDFNPAANWNSYFFAYPDNDSNIHTHSSDGHTHAEPHS